MPPHSEQIVSRICGALFRGSLAALSQSFSTAVEWGECAANRRPQAPPKTPCNSEACFRQCSLVVLQRRLAR
ncbi:hypothetical protein EBA01_12525 [Xanthomonas oryzae pv. oryzae]|nr:hypothetical protein BVV16_12665 [Xanthomonas oryzae pv. oryzae]AUI94515.1 hypothetical protein BVV17_12670 [Xanthomonas oryzae pv. oryzae]AUI98185.1 hypothetical protein BVV18_12675 [Xanthomonas oryzae pv. oryzae]AUJ01860.1 hypothetical protein BVV10_12675 [Xanthomonas oryzae pv. oryzae]AUJ05533.1 hypothetical protein BVV19_12695 [Xanthomonas oryzae pv. oryzae]